MGKTPHNGHTRNRGPWAGNKTHDNRPRGERMMRASILAQFAESDAEEAARLESDPTEELVPMYMSHGPTVMVRRPK